MQRRLAALIAGAALAITPAVVPGLDGTPAGVAPAIAKPCSSGWTHGVIRGAHKCLRRGQFCARGADRQYHRYGYHCHSQDARGNYHLT